MKLNSGLNRLMLILNVFPAFSLILVCIIAYYPLDSFPLLDVLGLITPVLVIVNLIFLLYWIVTKRPYVIVSFLPLLLGYLSFGSVYQLNSASEISKDGITVMSYNIQAYKSPEGMRVVREISSKVMSFIQEQDPDIMCYQEFSRFRMKELTQYPYFFQTPDGSEKTTQSIFSKYPIVGKGSLDFPDTGNNALYIDVVFRKDTLRVYNIHLQSYQVSSFRSLLKKQGGTDLLNRLSLTAAKHREQAEILQAHRETSPYPSIICGDFNQTPYSPSFQRIKEGMLDSYLEKGWGWGTTLTRNAISARIDFILADSDAFEVLEHRNYDIRYSDHLPIMARLNLVSD